MLRLAFAGQEFDLHPSGAMFWPAHGMLIVSDLHLEKGSHQARKGYFLPPYDSRETLSRLHEVLGETGARWLLLLGDCFHDAKGYIRLPKEERALFDQLTDFDPVWILGNHDGEFVPKGFVAHHEFMFQNMIFRHEAQQDSENEISGHFHPKAKLIHKGAKISRACFVEDGVKLMMPAFGAYAGGLSVFDPAVRQHFSSNMRLHVLSKTRIYTFLSSKSDDSDKLKSHA